jgi:hypothetical protein
MPKYLSYFLSLLLFSIAVALLMPQTSEAKLFRNSYVSFELPPSWKCQTSNTEWVCHSQFQKGAKSASIIFTAKEKGPSDTFSAYQAILRTPRNLKLKKSGFKKSKVIHLGPRRINNHEWMDGMHLGSEVGPYYTRYLATTKNNLAILVTFSAHRKVYTKYSNDFLKAIQSLRVVAPKDLLNMKGLNAGKTKYENIGAPIGTAMPTDLLDDIDGLPAEGSGLSSERATQLLGLALLIGALAFYFYIRSSKSKKKKRRRSSRPSRSSKKRSSSRRR